MELDVKNFVQEITRPASGCTAALKASANKIAPKLTVRDMLGLDDPADDQSNIAGENNSVYDVS